jgi:Phycobilisome protein
MQAPSPMYSKMMKLINETDNLHLTPPQQKELLDFARALPNRFAALRQIEANEVHIVDAALDAFQQLQPTVGDLADAGWPTATDDLRLAIRLIIVGWLMDDAEYAEAKHLRTLRQQLEYLDLPADAPRDLFVALSEAVAPLVSPETHEMVAPAFRAAVDAFDGVTAA